MMRRRRGLDCLRLSQRAAPDCRFGFTNSSGSRQVSVFGLCLWHMFFGRDHMPFPAARALFISSIQQVDGNEPWFVNRATFWALHAVLPKYVGKSPIGKATDPYHSHEHARHHPEGQHYVPGLPSKAKKIYIAKPNGDIGQEVQGHGQGDTS